MAIIRTDAGLDAVAKAGVTPQATTRVGVQGSRLPCAEGMPGACANDDATPPCALQEGNWRKRRRERDSASECKPSASESLQSALSREERHYRFSAGDVFLSRYRVREQLGQGTFGTVVLARDQVGGGDVAIKVVRAIPKYRREALVEADILSELRRSAESRQGAIPVAFMKDCFEDHGHVCLVFDRLGPTLLEGLDMVRRPHHRTASSYFCLRCIQYIARRMFEAIGFMHSVGLSHTDLKPENILFSSPDLSRDDLFEVRGDAAGR